MTQLVDFVDQMNYWRTFEKKPAMAFPLSQDDINEVAEQIDYKMSPENLHCDGEISNAEANSKANNLYKVFDQLKAHASSQGLKITVKVYEID
jgi:hypothetical protein